MKVVNNCAEVATKTAFNQAAFEASLRPGDVFYRKGDGFDTCFKVDGLMVFMRLNSTDTRYINLLSNNMFNTLSANKEYFLAPDATMVLNIEKK